MQEVHICKVQYMDVISVQVGYHFMVMTCDIGKGKAPAHRVPGSNFAIDDERRGNERTHLCLHLCYMLHLLHTYCMPSCSSPQRLFTVTRRIPHIHSHSTRPCPLTSPSRSATRHSRHAYDTYCLFNPRPDDSYSLPVQQRSMDELRCLAQAR